MSPLTKGVFLISFICSKVKVEVSWPQLTKQNTRKWSDEFVVISGVEIFYVPGHLLLKRCSVVVFWIMATTLNRFNYRIGSTNLPARRDTQQIDREEDR